MPGEGHDEQSSQSVHAECHEALLLRVVIGSRECEVVREDGRSIREVDTMAGECFALLPA